MNPGIRIAIWLELAIAKCPHCVNFLLVVAVERAEVEVARRRGDVSVAIIFAEEIVNNNSTLIPWRHI